MKANEKKKKPAFNVDTFLATMDGGRSISTYRKNQTVFSQGDSADAVFYIQEGKVKVCVVNELGKEAVVALHNKGDFFGEGCLSGQPLRLATAATMTECAIMRIDKVAMVRVLHDEPQFNRAVYGVSIGPECPRRGGLGGPAFQFERKASGKGTFANGEFRQRRKDGTGDYESQPSDAGGDGRHYATTRERLYEQISEARTHQLQRRSGSP